MTGVVYIVREPGKTGGREFVNTDDALDAARDWLNQTGIWCEIWLRWPDGTEHHSMPHTVEGYGIDGPDDPDAITWVA